VLVHFLDAGDFDLLRKTAKIMLKPGCTTTGFTDYMPNPPKIYINRSVASAGTIVHELLHYLTSRTFEQSFSKDIIEGATEYFTRNVLGQTTVNPNSAFAAFVGDRSRHYDEELLNVQTAHRIIRRSNVKEVRFAHLKRAYFLGAKDAIQILRDVVGGP
jgi:hypothetical protein